MDTKRKSKQMSAKEVRVFRKILSPSCLGEWNCLIKPDPSKYYYHPNVSTGIEELMDACPYVKECVIKNLGAYSGKVSLKAIGYYKVLKSRRKARPESSVK